MLGYIKNLMERNHRRFTLTHTYDELTKFFQMPLDKLAQKIKYDRSNILVLQGKERELKEEFSEIYDNILSCTHNRDNRTPMQYARDLVASWLFEDYIVSKFNELGYNLYLSGKDKERKILKNTKVGSDCDLIFEYNNRLYNIEVINDYSNYWKKNKKIDLRDFKFNKLLLTNSILLAISILDKTFTLIPIALNLNAKFIEFHFPYGGKPAYQIDINDIEFKEFKITNIINDLIKLIKK